MFTEFKDYIGKKTNLMPLCRKFRILPIEGKTPITTQGMKDHRICRGGGLLFVMWDEQTRLWSMRYEEGALPPPLKQQRFTSFQLLHKFAIEYYKTRNIQIIETTD